jgi:acyl-CoA thioester hydrolase
MITYRSTCRVIYGDTDGMGVAYHANYLRWFEIGRSELFRFLGMTYKDIESKGFYLPVSEAHCKFISPVIYDDILIIEASLDAKIKGGMKFDYKIFVKNDEKHHAEGYTRHACVNHEKKIVRRPEFLTELINNNL